MKRSGRIKCSEDKRGGCKTYGTNRNRESENLTCQEEEKHLIDDGGEERTCWYLSCHLYCQLWCIWDICEWFPRSRKHLWQHMGMTPLCSAGWSQPLEVLLLEASGVWLCWVTAGSRRASSTSSKPGPTLQLLRAWLTANTTDFHLAQGCVLL